MANNQNPFFTQLKDCGDYFIEEDEETKRLWKEFQSCARSVTKLYTDASWKSLQTAAADTTQLYKTSLEIRRTSHTNGFRDGRTALAKELLSALSCRNSIDIHTLMEFLRRSIDGNHESQRRFHDRHDFDEPDAGHGLALFEEVLTPNLATNAREDELDTFLAQQVQRHQRKRQRDTSPTSIIKKFKKQ
ncbi:unnamed protein product [Auanema sp. JU1783]|nr:unnamed protein product [Auanema sp. JU1783]